MWDDLQSTKDKMLARIEKLAADERAKILTPGAPYAEKLAEAREYMTGLTGRSWPFLEAEIERAGGTLFQAAERIIERADETATQLARIEAYRGRAKQAVRAATTMREAVIAAKWELSQ